MSHRNEPDRPLEPSADPGAGGSTASTVKDESAAVTNTATDAASDVGHRAMAEGEAVMGEAKDQLQDLYHQTRTELTDQASKQQGNIAGTLQALGDDFESMATNSDDGLASELVTAAAQRAAQVSSWLREREPGDVLEEVKAFARRQPGAFIGAAAIAGVLVGRLTRTMASKPQEESAANPDRGEPGRGEPQHRTGPERSERPENPLPDLPGTVRDPVPEPPPTPWPGLSTNAGGEEERDERPHTF